MKRAERGQATVEFALLLPVFACMVLALVQLALVIRADLLVHDAAREAARAASLADDAYGPVARLAPGATVLVTRSEVGAPVRARVELRYATTLPLVGVLFPDVVLHAEAEMRAER